MNDLSTYLELIKFLIYQKTNFSAFILIICSIIVTFLFFQKPLKAHIKRKNLNDPQNNISVDKAEYQKVQAVCQNENTKYQKHFLNFKKIFLAISSSALLIILSFLTYLNVGYIAFPDHNSFGVKISERDFSGKPSQETAELFFREIEEKNITKENSRKLREINLIILNLETFLKSNPKHIDTLSLLVKHKLEIFDFSGASNVQKKIIETKRNAALPSDYISLLKIMVASAKGYISPEAKRLIDLILKLEPSNIQTRFFNGHFYAQDGQLDRAEEIWDQLIVDYEREENLLQLVTSARTKYGIN